MCVFYKKGLDLEKHAVTISGKNLEIVTEIKHLDVILDSMLKFKDHASYVTKKNYLGKLV